MKTLLTQSLLVLTGIFISQNILCQVERNRITFMSEGHRLNAEIFLPSGDSIKPAIVLMHGFPGNEDDPLGLGEKLSTRGVVVFVFNYQGTWGSEGEFNFENSMIDARNAVRFLEQASTARTYHIDTNNICVAGYSFGGAMALASAIYYPEIQRICAIGGPNEAVYARKMLADSSVYDMFLTMFQSFEYPDGPVKFNSKSWIDTYLSHYENLDLLIHADALKIRDILLIGGWNDHNVLVEEHQIPLYRKLKESGADNVKLRCFETDHSFKGVRDEIAQLIFEWIFNSN